MPRVSHNWNCGNATRRLPTQTISIPGWGSVTIGASDASCVAESVEFTKLLREHKYLTDG